MTKEELFVKVQEVLVQEFELNADKIQLETRLYEDLDLDSIDAVDFIVKMKEYLPGKDDPDLFKTVRTVQDAVEVLYTLMQNG
jgi:acyl carrier protein